MRLSLIILVTCLVVLVLVEGKSSKDSKSKEHGSKSSKSEGKVTKVRPKPIRHHSSDSSDSSEEDHRHKHKKKHSERFKSEEEHFDSRKRNSTKNHKVGLKHNSTRILADVSNNRTGKLLSLTKNSTSHESFKFNGTKPTGHENKTLIGWKIFAKPNINKTNTVNETNNHILNSFLHSEKGLKVINGSQLNKNNHKGNNSVTYPPYGWKNFNATAPSQGWKNVNATAPSQGWNNHNGTAPSQGWKLNPNPVQGWNIQPSAPDYRKEYSVPDQRKDQRYYFGSPSIGGYQQRNPNSIGSSNQPVAYPQAPDYNRKMISDISPEYGWALPQNSYMVNNDQYNTDGKVFDSYPLNKNYESSEKSSSKLAKGVKKLFKKLGEGTGEALSSDQAKDVLKKAASSYFANPPPNGLIYDPPLGEKRQTFYGSVLRPVGKEAMSADDWRSVIFGNVPRKAETRNLYSAAFPETYQGLDLNAFSEKGRLPDFNQTQYKSFFPRPYYQKIFAGLQNEEINEHFRTKRELSEKGKAMAEVINKFFLHERDCNDTDLDARRKRHLMIRPLGKNATSNYEEEKIINNFSFSGVEAIIQSDNGLTVYEEVPKEIETEKNSTQKSLINEENASSKALSVTQNRTKLYPVSETIEQFLNKKPATRLRVIDESLETWKSKARAESNTFITQISEVTDSSNSKRIARSDDISSERNYTPFYRWINDFSYSDSDVITPYSSQNYQESNKRSEYETDLSIERDMKSTTPRIYIQDSNEYRSTNPSAKDNPKDEETTKSTDSSGKNGFYFFGVFIDDYDNDHKWESHSSKPDSEEFAIATVLPGSSTDNSDLENALTETTISSPALRYTNTEEISTKKVQLTSEPTFSESSTETSISKDYPIPEPSQSLFFTPFRINTISSIRYGDDVKEGRRSTLRGENDPEPVQADTSIIKAPPLKNRCGQKQRMEKGRCRTVW